MLAEIPVPDQVNPSSSATAAKTIRVGLLGLGNVGQAIARLAPEAERLKSSGVRFRILSALVRDVRRERHCPLPPRLTAEPDAFLREHYDVVIEALGGVEPARTIVARLLGRGTPVVTANKALVAAHGLELAALAERRGTTLRYEASALAGVPFLGALTERPFVADVNRFTAVVNGTSNFILSTIDSEQCPFGEALARAQSLGLTEPDPSRDLDGIDAADKFFLLASVFGWGTCSPEKLELRGIRGIDAADLAAARRLKATIKPVVWARKEEAGIEAFIGPALVAREHPLASLSGTLSGIQLSGTFISNLFFSGPGAGPDVTAATTLDDAIEAVSMSRRFPKRIARCSASASVSAPVTEWFVRARFPGVAPDATAAEALFSNAGLSVVATTDAADGKRWLQVRAASHETISSSVATLQHRHRIDCFAMRAIGL